MRLQKYLAHQGYGSRRTCEKWIEKGWVQVNGKVITEQGVQIDPEKDKIKVQEEEVRSEHQKARTILLNKPRGVVCTTSKEEGRTVFELIPSVKEKLVPVGRLDKKSEGLLLMSNDGELTYKVTHPSFGQKKIYHVVVSGECSERVLTKLNAPMHIDGYRTRPAEVKILRKSKVSSRKMLEFVLKEGRNHQIRKMCLQVHLNIHRLTRVQTKNLKLQGLRPGEWRDLTSKEVEALKK